MGENLILREKCQLTIKPQKQNGETLFLRHATVWFAGKAEDSDRNGVQR